MWLPAVKQARKQLVTHGAGEGWNEESENKWTEAATVGGGEKQTSKRLVFTPTCSISCSIPATTEGNRVRQLASTPNQRSIFHVRVYHQWETYLKHQKYFYVTYAGGMSLVMTLLGWQVSDSTALMQAEIYIQLLGGISWDFAQIINQTDLSSWLFLQCHWKVYSLALN